MKVTTAASALQPRRRPKEKRSYVWFATTLYAKTATVDLAASAKSLGAMSVFGTFSPVPSKTAKECQPDVVRTSSIMELPRAYSMRKLSLHTSSNMKSSAHRSHSTVRFQLALHSSHHASSSPRITLRDWRARVVLLDCVQNVDRPLSQVINALLRKTLYL